MIAVFIQARTGSQRLPNKVLKELPKGSGVCVLMRVVNRVRKCKNIDEIIIISPDDLIIQIAQKEGLLYSQYKSEKRDVLAEFYHAAKVYKPDTIVRITADCPCVDPKTIDRLVEEHLKSGADLTYNRNDNLTYCSEIDGLDVEIMTHKALELAHEQATLPTDREHVTSWLHNLLTTTVECGWDCDNPKDIKLSIDTQEDYDRMCKLYEDLGTDFDTRDIIRYLEKEKK